MRAPHPSIDRGVMSHTTFTCFEGTTVGHAKRRLRRLLGGNLLGSLLSPAYSWWEMSAAWSDECDGEPSGTDWFFSARLARAAARTQTTRITRHARTLCLAAELPRSCARNSSGAENMDCLQAHSCPDPALLLLALYAQDSSNGLPVEGWVRRSMPNGGVPG